MIWPLLYGYALMAVLFAVGLGGFVFDDDDPPGPPGSEPALRFLFGLFWALVVVVVLGIGAGWMLWRIGGGFAALWRWLRPR